MLNLQHSQVQMGLWSKSHTFMEDLAKHFRGLFFLETRFPGVLFDDSKWCPNEDKIFMLRPEEFSPANQEQCKKNQFTKSFNDCCWECPNGSSGLKDMWKAMAQRYKFVLAFIATLFCF